MMILDWYYHPCLPLVKLTYWWSKGSWCGGRHLPTCFSPFDSTLSNHWWSRWYFRYYASTKHKNLGNVSFPMLLLVDRAISSLFVQQYTKVYTSVSCFHLSLKQPVLLTPLRGPFQTTQRQGQTPQLWINSGWLCQSFPGKLQGS